MDSKKLILASIAATVFVFVTDYVFYGMLTTDFFTQVPGQREMPNFLILILGTLCFAIPFAYFYPNAAGATSKVAEGFKYGAIAAVMVFVSIGLIMHGVYDWGGSMTEVIADIVYRIVQIGICGIVVAYVYNLPAGRPGGATGGGGDG